MGNSRDIGQPRPGPALSTPPGKLPGQPSPPPPDSSLPDTDRQRFGRWVVTWWHKFKGLFRHLPKEKEDAQTLVTRLTERSSAKSFYKTAAVLELYVPRQFKLQSRDGNQVSFAEKQIAIDTDTLVELRQTLELNPTEIAYRFELEKRPIPTGYLKHELYPHLAEELNQRLRAQGRRPLHDPTKIIEALANRVGLVSEQKFSFERMLELKRAIRKRFGPSLEEQAEKSKPKPPSLAQYDPEQPHLTPPPLKSPGKREAYLEKEDTAFIKMTVESGGSLKLEPMHDVRNRVKRWLLRNKRGSSMNGVQLVVGSVLAAVVTGGISAAVTVLISIGYLAFWSGGREAVRMAKVIRKMHKMERSADYVSNPWDPEDIEAFDNLDEEKFKVFMKCCRYVCSHDTLTRIYNAYAELEKDAEKSIELAQKERITVSDTIAFEESKARYQLRRKNMEVSFNLFNRLYTGVVGDLKRLERKWQPEIEALWNEKFRDMDEKERLAIFKQAAKDRRVNVRGHRIHTKSPNWLSGILPKLASVKQSKDQEDILQKASMAMDEPTEKSHVKLEEESATLTNSAIDKIKLMGRTFVVKQLRKAIFRTITHGFKITWAAGSSLPSLQVKPELPKITVDGLILFVFFFFADLAVEARNNKQNTRRMEKIQKGVKSKTGLGTKRERTGREEIATLRAMTKKQLPSVIDSLFDFHKLLEEHCKTLEDNKQRSLALGVKPYSQLTDQEAAVIILQQAAWQQLLEKKIGGAFGLFYQHVTDKTYDLDRKMTEALVEPEPAQRQKTPVSLASPFASRVPGTQPPFSRQKKKSARKKVKAQSPITAHSLLSSNESSADWKKPAPVWQVQPPGTTLTAERVFKACSRQVKNLIKAYNNQSLSEKQFRQRLTQLSIDELSLLLNWIRLEARENPARRSELNPVEQIVNHVFQQSGRPESLTRQQTRRPPPSVV